MLYGVVARVLFLGVTRLSRHFLLTTRKSVIAIMPTTEVVMLYSNANKELTLVQRNPKIEFATNELKPIRM